MGYKEMSTVDEATLFSWLVEEVGELGRVLIRKRFDGRDEEKAVDEEMADVWNVLHAIALKRGVSEYALKLMADFKGTNFIEHK